MPNTTFGLLDDRGPSGEESDLDRAQRLDKNRKIRHRYKWSILPTGALYPQHVRALKLKEKQYLNKLLDEEVPMEAVHRKVRACAIACSLEFPLPQAVTYSACIAGVCHVHSAL